MMTEAHGWIKPDAGVAATKAAMDPEQKPTMLNFRSKR